VPIEEEEEKGRNLRAQYLEIEFVTFGNTKKHFFPRPFISAV